MKHDDIPNTLGEAIAQAKHRDEMEKNLKEDLRQKRAYFLTEIAGAIPNLEKAIERAARYYSLLVATRQALHIFEDRENMRLETLELALNHLELLNDYGIDAIDLPDFDLETMRKKASASPCQNAEGPCAPSENADQEIPESLREVLQRMSDELGINISVSEVRFGA